MKKMLTKIILWAFFIVFCALLVGCQYSNEPVQILTTSETIKLEWDPPLVDYFVTSYKIYYKRNNSTWILLDEIPSSENPGIRVYHSDIGNGFIEFAVSSVDKYGAGSALHTSRDQNADPINGWYLFWVRSR